MTVPTVTLASIWASHKYGLDETGLYLQLFVLFAWLVYVFETYLDIRQHRMFDIQTKPTALTYINQQEFTKMQNCQEEETRRGKVIEIDSACSFVVVLCSVGAHVDGHDKSSFGFLTSLWGNVKLTAYLYYGYYPLIWNVAGYILTGILGFDSSSTMIQTCIFYLVDTTLDTILGIPLTVYKTFVIEEKHGFNKQTAGLFISDQIKGLLLNFVIAPPLLSLFVWVIEWGGEHFYLYVAGLFFVIQMLAIPFYSNFIQPLFNKVEPLPAGTLRSSIEKLASSINFPLTELYVIDGSKRSSHSNAYFCQYYHPDENGFFKSKRIVIFDTLINQTSEIQVLSVLGHELGHWSLNHTVKNLVLMQAQMFVMFFLFGQVIHSPRLYSDFGFHSSQPTYMGLLFFSFIYSPVQHVTSFLMNVLSRKFEFEADHFAVDLGYGKELSEALISLQKENKGTPISDPAYSAYHHSHPPLLQRLQAIEQAIGSKGKKAE